MKKDAEFGQRLKLLRKQKKLKQVEAASLIGISYSSLQNHEAGRWPSRSTLEKYLKFYGCDRGWLLTGKGTPFPTTENTDTSSGNEDIDALHGALSNGSFLDPNEYVFVPLVEGQVTAGPDGGILFDKPDDIYPFKKWWIIKKVGHNPERHKALTLVRIRGDSMVPTIYPGEVVLVDTWEAERVEIKDGKIYLVRMPDGTITVKRVILNVRDNSAYLVCLSDNQNYEPFKFLLDKPIQWYILGRIRWVGREID